MKKFENLTIEDLEKLRNEICLNSIYVADYGNSFGFSPKSVCTFFDGFMSYINEIAKEDYEGQEVDIDILFDEYDNLQNLWDWFLCADDYSWVEYEEEKEEGEGIDWIYAFDAFGKKYKMPL